MAIKLIFKCLHILSCEYEFVINMLTRDNSQLNFHGGKNCVENYNALWLPYRLWRYCLAIQ